MASIHHVEIGTRKGHGEQTVKSFVSKYPFYISAVRKSCCGKQWLVQSDTGNVRFVFTDILDENKVHDDPYCSQWYRSELNLTCDTKTSHRVGTAFKSNPSQSVLSLNDQSVQESVFNVAFDVKNVPSKSMELENRGVNFVKQMRTLEDENGSVVLCIVKSVVGNVVHTLLDASNYHGVFLPEFYSESSSHVKCPDHSMAPSILSHIDHFTFVCPFGFSGNILKWYEDNFRMQRFFINRDEDETDGFVINNSDVGLRMKALEYWKCAEVGMCSKDTISIKFVIAEALPNQGPNQIDAFLEDHGDAGIQHIGLLTPSIFDAVKSLKDKGVEFAEPPVTYYSKLGRLDDIESVGEDLQGLMEFGILIDTEEPFERNNSSTEHGSDDLASGKKITSTRYLMQKFTKPLFAKRTFFLEIIQRHGALGFGSGNITALWKSVQAYMDQKRRNVSLENDE